MHVVITGADGFIGRGLVERLSADERAWPRTRRLTLVDRQFATDRSDPAAPSDPSERRVTGDLTDGAVLDVVFDEPVDLLIHLASVPGATAERQYDAGRRANLDVAFEMAHRLATQHGRRNHHNATTHPAPRVVFASSIAVYGPMGPRPTDEHQLPAPAISYGAHKLMTEILLADLTRRGVLDARSIRLPGIVARPPSESGHGSAFMSQLFHRMASREPYVCPVTADATAWWMSRRCCIDNIIHAARLDAEDLPRSRSIQLPVLHLAVGELIEALRARFDAPRSLVTHCPEPAIEATFGRYPAIETPIALAAGFRHDGDIHRLIDAALNDGERPIHVDHPQCLKESS